MKNSLTLFITFVGLLLLQNVQAQSSETITTIDSVYKIDEITNYNEPDSAYNDFAEEVIGDTSVSFNERMVDKDSLIALKNKPAYSWLKNIEKQLRSQQEEEASSVKQIPIKDTGGGGFFENVFNSLWLKGILWSAAILLVLYIIYQLFLNKGIFQRSSKKLVEVVEKEVVEDSMENDFDTLLNKAYQAGNLKMAMRYLFLKTIQTLHQKELIHYTADKTNAIYMSELPAQHRNQFAKLAMYYEYVWYGNTPISNDVFNQIQQQYQQFLNQL
ncbi:hypothetical protein ACFOWM_13660 [Ferruginibacter yonginensis]|uniref:DUF4129 domain-containing protein n=1 Tax=Ferruginibacter yonginensis TaxID=1310416 RepID=A0ABV8QWA7_9BACT